jgi:hypothetical protein
MGLDSADSYANRPRGSFRNMNANAYRLRKSNGPSPAIHVLRDDSDSAMREEKKRAVMTPPDTVENTSATSYPLEDNKSVQ